MIDRSLLRPSFIRLYFKRVLRVVPRRLPANFLTLGAFGVTVALLYVCVTGALTGVRLAWAALVTAQLYVIGDHLDGLQAVVSDTTSPLGEFLDHWLDFLSGAILGFAALALMGESLPRWAFLGVIWLYALAFIVTYVERSERRLLYFARVGALEGIVILSAAFAVWSFPAGFRFMAGPSLPGGLPGYGILLAIAVTCFSGTAVLILVRMGSAPHYFLALSASSGAIVVAGAVTASGVPLAVTWAILVTHCADALARVMQPHLFTGVRGRFPDPLAPIGVVALTVGGVAAPRLELGIMWWAGANMLWAAGVVVAAYREHWHWVTPYESR